ncbi:VWA domain-containing protein [Enterovirga sp.]|uniref:vWA domain-containing protein n=1 Tax=Enterovirga sp. TaxID=2026350 RepID=UPI002B9C81DD|nr:VWA domain-containing protein [Enterovirga sp.]HMO30857.1 VWA domain-containing protein [Enterovirga sp.]
MSGHLADNVALFGRALRAAGIPVGPGAIVDAVGAVEAAGIRRREDLYWTLHSVLVSRREQMPVFDAAFRLFWRRRGFVEKLLAEMSPLAPGEKGREKPKPGETRVLEAMQPRKARREEETVEREVSARLTASDRDVLKERDFAQMTAQEIARARRVIEAMRLPDDDRPTRRLRPDPRGRLVDLRRSLRGSLRGGGATINLAFRSRHTRPPPLVAIVDISGSMAEYSRLFLHFLHTLAEKRRRVHGFVFATRLTNITRDLAHRDPDDALARAAARVKDWEGGTRIASALRDFNRLWSRRVLGQGAVVLLFTDGLEREAGSDLAFEMDRLRRSCGRLVWLNPLLRFGAFEARAAGIRAMLPHVDEFRPIHSLASMEELVRALGTSRPDGADPARWLRAAS